MKAKFYPYLDPEIPLRSLMRQAFETMDIPDPQQRAISGFLAPLRIKDPATYEHSLRVGLLARRIAAFMHLDGKAGFYAGLLHDVGKTLTSLSTLQKTDGWTPADAEEIKSHVMDGHRFLRGTFDFTAEVILWHHRFQPGAYPETLPSSLHRYSPGTQILIPVYGRILSIADSFDAAHRGNDRFGGAALNGEDIKRKMLEWNKDQAILIKDLYESGILTTKIYAEPAAVS
ncbi:MAG TPA: HD domain-containing protein [Candidatus Paceibacterota bacterium]|nr:HD domain-containing protein [Candidatus Paceibacterota bacterium]